MEETTRDGIRNNTFYVYLLLFVNSYSKWECQKAN